MSIPGQTLFTIVALVLAAGCKPQDAPTSAMSTSARFDGQIFITRNDSETVKLSSVQVGLLDSNAAWLAKQSIESYMEKEKAGEARIRALERMENDERAEERGAWSIIDRLEANQQDLTERITRLTYGLRQMSPEKAATAETAIGRFRLQFASNQTVLAQVKAANAEAHDKLESIRAEARVEKSKLLSLNSYSAFAELQWPIRQTSQTDADGNFSFRADANKNWMIVAKSSRQVFSKKEKYFWLVPARPNDRVLLNNANLTAQDEEKEKIEGAP